MQLYQSSSAYLLFLSLGWSCFYSVLQEISEAQKCHWKCSRINQKGATVIYGSVFLKGASHLETKSFMAYYVFEDSDGTFSFFCFLYACWAE